MNKLQIESRRNYRLMKQREALFRRFGYDSKVSLKFIVAKVLPLPGHVLEIGTGKGRFLAAMAKHTDRITTLDVDAEQQRAAKLHIRQTQAGHRIRFVAHDAGHLPWPDANFDTVSSVNTFHHLERPMRVFQEMLRVLKPGGKLVLCDFSPRGFQIFDRIHRFEGGTHPRLKNGLAEFGRLLRRPGWKIRRFKGCNQEILVAIAPPVPIKEKKTQMITIAIPTNEGRLHGHFGGCREFTLVQADPEQRKIISIQTVAAPQHQPGLFPRWLREQGANVIIVGGIGQRALAVFAQQGIEVRAGKPDTSVEVLATACLNGQLVNAPAGCTHHHHDEEGGHHHHDGEHHHCHE